jgi:hypothetical protein
MFQVFHVKKMLLEARKIFFLMQYFRLSANYDISAFLAIIAKPLKPNG